MKLLNKVSKFLENENVIFNLREEIKKLQDELKYVHERKTLLILYLYFLFMKSLSHIKLFIQILLKLKFFLENFFDFYYNISIERHKRT